MTPRLRWRRLALLPWLWLRRWLPRLRGLRSHKLLLLWHIYRWVVNLTLERGTVGLERSNINSLRFFSLVRGFVGKLCSYSDPLVEQDSFSFNFLFIDPCFQSSVNAGNAIGLQTFVLCSECTLSVKGSFSFNSGVQHFFIVVISELNLSSFFH